jgi:hypothetical protein
MEPICKDIDGNDLFVGDLVDATDDQGTVHRVRVTGYFTQPVHHEDGTKEFVSIDIEKFDFEGLKQGYVTTSRVRKVNLAPI